MNKYHSKLEYLQNIVAIYDTGRFTKETFSLLGANFYRVSNGEGVSDLQIVRSACI